MYWKAFVYLLAVASISAIDDTHMVAPITDFGIFYNFSVPSGFEHFERKITINPLENIDKDINPTENVLLIDLFAKDGPKLEPKKVKRQDMDELPYYDIDSEENNSEYLDFIEDIIPNSTSEKDMDYEDYDGLLKKKKRHLVMNEEEYDYGNNNPDDDSAELNGVAKDQDGKTDQKFDIDEDDHTRYIYGHVRDSRRSKILKNPQHRYAPIEKIFLDTYNGSRVIAYLVEEDEDVRNVAINFITNFYKIRPDGHFLRFYLALFNHNSSTEFLESTKNMNSFKTHLKPEPKDNSTQSKLGIQNRSKPAATLAMAKSAQFLPNDSGMLLFLNRGPIDEHLMAHVRTALLLKRIKLYVVWSGPYPTRTKEETLLVEMCKVSGGAFLIADLGMDVSENRFKYYANEESSDLALLEKRKNLVGDNTINFPIDSEVTAIHFVLKPFTNDTVGLLTTSRGKRIIITDKSKVEEYNSLSFVNKADDQFEVHLAINLRDGYDVGNWKLKTLTSIPTNVTVYVYTELTANVFYVTGNTTKTPGDRHLQFEFLGDLLTVNKIIIQNQYGKPIMDNLLNNKEYLKVSESYENSNANNLTTDAHKIQDIQFEIALDRHLPNDNNMYAIISGKDHKGYDFNRMALVRRLYTTNDEVFPQSPLTVSLGPSSALIVQPNKYSDIYFEVSNRGNKAAQVYFSIRGEQHILYSMSPYRKILSPDETTTVKVTIAPRSGTYQDHLVFQAGGGSVTVQKTVIVDVGSDIVDTESPDIAHKYLSDCTTNWGPCEDATWTILVKAIDMQSGLLQVTSNPRGLYFRNEFTAGTKEYVSGYYSGICCNPDIIITAVDRKQNAYTKKFNAYTANWGIGAIMGLVLGIIMLLFLMMLVIWLIHKWMNRRAESFDLPVYRSNLRHRY